MKEIHRDLDFKRKTKQSLLEITEYKTDERYKEELNKWIIIPCSWKGSFNIIRMPVSPI